MKKNVKNLDSNDKTFLQLTKRPLLMNIDFLSEEQYS